MNERSCWRELMYRGYGLRGARLGGARAPGLVVILGDGKIAVGAFFGLTGS